MTISVGDRLPEASFVVMTDKGPHQVSLGDKLKGRKVVVFAVPGAFSNTCDVAHVPSFIRTREALAAKGVEEILCIAVNDPFVMKAWGESTGATKAGITMLADSAGDYTRAIGMDFDAPVVGFHGRAIRHAMLVEGGEVKILLLEEGRGVCEATAGEALLAAMG